MSTQPQNNNSANNKRIAKNTLVLYVRMLFLMAISLYTSRVILDALGVEDYGVYNVVGGFVALFSVLSKSLTSASTRFINFEMGKGSSGRLKDVFATSVCIQYLMAILIAVLCELVGVWFVNNKMVIAPDRLFAANWVFQFSIFTFCSNLITVPYNAAIIAHERMKTFAYVSVFEGCAKLGISFLVMVSPIDTLIFYAALICALQFCIQAMYRIYCRHQFEECKTSLHYDSSIVKEMGGYAGWTFIGTSASIIRNQGGNILINLFFGPAANAARGVANQVLHAVNGFVTNFTMAINPQITQSYARGDYNYMLKLVYMGARFSYYMLLVLCLPILLNTTYILSIWLKEVPEGAIIFTQLTLIFTMLESLSHTLIKAQQSTGQIKWYQIIVGGIQLLNVPISYIVYRLGGAAESFIYVAIGCGIACLIARIIMLRPYVKLDSWDFIKNVVFNVLFVTLVSLPLPLITLYFIPTGFYAFFTSSLIAVFCSCIAIMFIGCNTSERKIVLQQINKLTKKLKKS